MFEHRKTVKKQKSSDVKKAEMSLWSVARQ